MNDPARIRWTNRASKPKIEVLAPKPNQTLKVIAAGPVVGVMVHWCPGLEATRPCTCDPEDSTHQGLPLAYWKGYLPAVTHSGRRVIVEITQGAADNCKRILADDIAGLWVSVQRRGDSACSPIYVWFAEHEQRATDVKPYDPIPRLLDMWGFPVAEASLPPVIVNGREGGQQS